jgi:hypothetical protein
LTLQDHSAILCGQNRVSANRGADGFGFSSPTAGKDIGNTGFKITWVLGIRFEIAQSKYGFPLGRD